MAAKFALIRYQQRDYANLAPRLDEITGHFDTEPIDQRKPYSLHTDQAYGGRKFDRPIFRDLPRLREAAYEDPRPLKATHRLIPELWRDDEWSKQFFDFVVHLVGKSIPPTIVEIHPPFRYYCDDEDCFLHRYGVFEDLLLKKYPHAQIVIENRRSSRRGRRFLMQDASDLASMGQAIRRHERRLRLVVDIPQLIDKPGRPDNRNFIETMNVLSSHKNVIFGIHLWGWKGASPHNGNLNTLFGDEDRKKKCLSFLSSFFNDGVERYLVPEVGSDAVFPSVRDDLVRHFNLV